MKQLLTYLAIFTTVVTFAQPANDNCSGATTISTTGGCIGGTTVAASDGWVGTVGCQSGNNDEVWYTFVSTGTQSQITVTSGTLGGNVEVIMVQSIGACAGLSLSGSQCGASPLVATFSNLQPGVTYYVSVSSTGADGTFTICNTVSSPPPAPGQDCTAPAILCSNTAFSQGSFSGIGVAETVSTNTCFGSQERQSRWYTFTIGCSGTFGFIVTPVTASNDIDWVILARSTATCYSSGTTINTGQVSCNWSGCPGATGITDVANPCTTYGAADCGGMPGCQAGGINSTLANLTAGTTYMMLIDNFSNSGNGFSVQFLGTAVIGPDAAFTTSLSADCFTVTPTKTCATSNSTYLWNFGDGTTSTSQNPGAYTYASSGNYTLSLTVTDALGCSKTVSQTINVGCLPLPVELGSFNVERLVNESKLTWTLKSELNNDFFFVERSFDGVEWMRIMQVPSIGDHTTDYTYTRSDDLTQVSQDQTIYYRLWQTDKNGETELLGMNVISGMKGFESDIELSVVPNPSEGYEDANLMIASRFDSQGTLSISDASGNILNVSDIKVAKGVNSFPLEIAELAKGVYLISYEVDGEKTVTRMVKL